MSSRSAIGDVIATLDAPDLSTSDAPDAELGDGPVRWVAAVVEAAIGDLLADDHADAFAPWDDVRTFAKTHLLDVLRDLGRGDDEPGDTASGESAFDAHVADIFAREVPLNRVLDTVATLHNRCLTMLVDHALAQQHGEVVATVVRDVTRIANRWIQTCAERYLAESRRRIDSTQARIRAAVESLVAGDPVEPVDAQLLGVPLDGWHVGCVVTALPGRAMDHRSVDRVAASFARAVHAESVLRYETSTGQIWLWASDRRQLQAPEPGAVEVSAPMAVGVGRPHPGAAGLRRTHLEAMDAVRIARDVEAPTAVGIDDVALAAALSVDEERARWFVERELTGLIGDDEQSADLRDTLRAFYAVRMRVAPAAERLFVHRNTLINRLDRVERLLGHSVAERTAEVQAALVLHDIATRSVTRVD